MYNIRLWRKNKIVIIKQATAAQSERVAAISKTVIRVRGYFARREIRQWRNS